MCDSIDPMHGTRVTVDLGGSPIGESVTVVVTGAPCRTRKAVEDIVAVLKGHRAMNLKADAVPPKKPCGCKDEDAPQR